MAEPRQYQVRGQVASQAGAAIDVHDYIAFRLTKMLSRSRDHGFFQVHEYRFLIDILIAGYVIHDP